MSISMYGALRSDGLTLIRDDGEALLDAARRFRDTAATLSDEAKRARRAWSQLPTVLYAAQLTPVLDPLMEPAVTHARQLHDAAENFYRVASSAADDLAAISRERAKLVSDIDAFHASAPGKAAQHAAMQASSGNLIGTAAAAISSWQDVPALVRDESALRWRAEVYENKLTEILNGIAAGIDAIGAPTALNRTHIGAARAVGYTRKVDGTHGRETAWHSTEDFGSSAWTWTENEGKKARPSLQDFAAQAGNGLLSLAQAIHNHPGEFGTFVAGIAVIAAGGSEEVVGGALDFTGVGVGVPVNVAGAATIAAGAGIAGAGASGLIDHAMGDDAQSRFDTTHVMESRAAKYPKGERGEPNPDYAGRNKGGKWTSKDNDVSRDESMAKEAQGLEQYEERTGLKVDPDQVVAKQDGSNVGRKYDGLAEKPDGTYEGIEVKSGAATRTAQQKEFDSKVSYENPAHATLHGVRIKITSVVVRIVK